MPTVAAVATLEPELHRNAISHELYFLGGLELGREAFANFT